jgi:hypothetical protein
MLSHHDTHFGANGPNRISAGHHATYAALSDRHDIHKSRQTFSRRPLDQINRRQKEEKCRATHQISQTPSHPPDRRAILVTCTKINESSMHQDTKWSARDQRQNNMFNNQQPTCGTRTESETFSLANREIRRKFK